MRALVVVVALLAGCAGTFGGERRDASWWAPRDTALEVAFAGTVALTACDVGGTLGATNMGRFDRETRPGYVLGEANPILQAVPGIGAKPSVAAMIAAPALATAVSYAVTRAPLPRWARWTWLGVVTAVEAWAVANNAQWSGACGVAATRYPAGASPAARH